MNNYCGKILNTLFDNEMIQSINTFAAELSNADADVFIIMARKAACFIRFLQECGLIDIAGIIVTDRVLDIDSSWIKDKKVAIVDDVIVSGTTIYQVIEQVKKAGPSKIEVFVLGVTEASCNLTIFDYYIMNGEKKNYIHSPYVSMTEAGCIRACSNIVSIFSLDISPYDVDFPRYKTIQLSEYSFHKIFYIPNWKSYDVSSSLQSKNGIFNITLIPDKEILKKFDEIAGFSASKMGFYKIRVFARKENSKSKPYLVNFVPYYLFDAISENDINILFETYFAEGLEVELQTKTKLRLLQYIIAAKLFSVWLDEVGEVLNKKLNFVIDKDRFEWIFPRKFYFSIENKINMYIKAINLKSTTYIINFKKFKSSIPISADNLDNKALMQSKLIEPFTALYHDVEKTARSIVKEYGKKAFELSEYKEVLDRLNHGYSYQELIDLLSEFPDQYDKNTMVSLFLDEAIDAGIVVPIISREKTTIDNAIHNIYYRSYRHGEDVPFGEEQEKMCSILLKSYYSYGKKDILSKLRIEKLLVLFINIGLAQNLFKFNPEDEILYKVNVSSYLHGNIVIADHPTTKRSVLYLIHRTDAVWLVDKLIAKEILIVNEKTNKYERVEDNIDLPIDEQTQGKISVIGNVFGMLYCNKKKNKTPYMTDYDLILFSTCLYPKDIINALAAELAICCDRWRHLSKRNIPIGEIANVYKRDNLYISINSGKKKYFSFINKEALCRINEITEQFYANKDTEIFSNIWKQFWPENKDWNTRSIGESVRMIVNREGQCLIWYNILFRLLFASCAMSSDERFEWIKQAKDLCGNDVLGFKEFSNDSVSANIKKQVQKMDLDLKAGNSLNNYYISVVKAINWLTDFKAVSLLQEAELYVDKHGKPIEIEHFGYVIQIKLNKNEYKKCEIKICNYLNDNNIDGRTIRQDIDGELLSGIWVVIRNNSKSFISKIIQFIFILKIPINCIIVFWGLSDSLKIRSKKNINSQYKYGNFLEYSKEVYQFVESIKEPNTNKIFVARELNSSDKKEIPATVFSQFDCLHSKRIKSEVLFYDEIEIKTYQSKYEGGVNMLYEWYKDQKPMSVFVSYTESSPKELDQIRKIVKRLNENNINTFFYEDQPLGTDMVEFMRKIKESNFVLIIGSKTYKKKAESLKYNYSGVSFEDKTIADLFQSLDRDRIIPVTFGDIEKTIPVPYNKLKGIRLKNDSDESLTPLVEGLINAYKLQIQKKSKNK